MMSGCVDYPVLASSPKTRRYEVIARGGGWSISINGACTSPFRNRRGAERIARMLQRQANALGSVLSKFWLGSGCSDSRIPEGVLECENSIGWTMKRGPGLNRICLAVGVVRGGSMITG